MGFLHRFNNRPYLSPLELRSEEGKVQIIFAQPMKFVNLTPEQAESIGTKLVEFSRLAKGSIIIPGVDAK